MINKLNYKWELLLYITTFSLLYLIFNGTYTFSKPLSSFFSIFTFRLTGLPYTLLRDLILVAPYIVLIIILILVFLHFSNLIKARSIRRSLKFVSLFLLLSGPIFILSAIVNPPPIDRNNIFPQKSTTTTTTGTTNVTSTSFTELNSTSTTSTNITSNTNSHSTNNPLVVNPNINQGLFNIIIFLALILLLGFFIRNLQTGKTLNGDGNNDQDSNLKQFQKQDAIRRFMITEYLKISQELESNGINPDFSLTPMEFEDETVLNLNIDEIRKITYYYELARFSNRPITNAELEDFTNILNDLYERLKILNQNLDNTDK